MTFDLWPLQSRTRMRARIPNFLLYPARALVRLSLSLITKNIWGWIRVCPRFTFVIQTLSHSVSSEQTSELCLDELEKGGVLKKQPALLMFSIKG